MDSVCYFDTVSAVCDSWERLKRTSMYQENLGVGLFQQMYELEADGKWNIFPWTKEEMEEKDAKFLNFAMRFVRMFDMSIDMLGPDMEIVEEQLYELGSSHQRYGVTPKHFELMGRALVLALEKILGDKVFDSKTKTSWKTVYDFMSMTMIQGAAGI